MPSVAPYYFFSKQSFQVPEEEVPRMMSQDSCENNSPCVLEQSKYTACHAIPNTFPNPGGVCRKECMLYSPGIPR